MAKSNEKSNLRVVNVHLLQTDLDFIDNFLDRGLATTRAEYIRNAVHKAVREDHELVVGPYIKMKKALVEGESEYG